VLALAHVQLDGCKNCLLKSRPTNSCFQELPSAMQRSLMKQEQEIVLLHPLSFGKLYSAHVVCVIDLYY